MLIKTKHGEFILQNIHMRLCTQNNYINVWIRSLDIKIGYDTGSSTNEMPQTTRGCLKKRRYKWK